MEPQGALDDGSAPLSRREIRQLRREFAKLDRLGGSCPPGRESVPAPRAPQDETTAAVEPAGPVRRTGLRLGVLVLALLGTLMMLATVLPTGPSRPEPAPAPSPAATQQSDQSRLDGRPVTEQPPPGPPVFQGPFGP